MFTFVPAPVPALVLSLAAIATPVFAQNLPTDPRLVTGKLENGLTYIIRHHEIPKGRVELQIHFASGSMNESDSQRGLAHYLEHMAFNGSENFEPGSLIPFFQSMGLQFGRDQNAYTNMSETVYQLSLPENSPELLEKSVMFFSDVSGRLHLLPAEIENERQIILEERTRSLGGQQRVRDYVMDRLVPGSLVGKRLTIGTAETIKSVNQDDFKDYWGKYYVSSNATMVVVGDIEPGAVKSLIEKHFGTLPKKDRPTRQDMKVKPAEKPFAIVASDPEITTGSVAITRIDLPRPAPKTIPEYKNDLVESIAASCFNLRMTDKVSAGGTSYQRLSAQMSDQPYAMRQCGVEASCEPAKWKDALKDAALELQRARQFGFTERELNNVKKRILSSAERAVQTESTTPSKGILGGIIRDIGVETVTMSAEQELKLMQELLPSITLAEVSSHFAKEMEPRNCAFVAILPAGSDVPTEAQLLELGTEALKVKPTKEVEVARAETLMEKLPEGGKVAQSAVHEGAGVWNAWLSNGVRVHHKFMDERKDSATISISLFGGELLETAENRGITGAAALAFNRPATSKLTSSDIRDLMTGKKVVVGGGGGGGGRRGGGGVSVADGLKLVVSGSPAELETGMQLAHLLLTDPKVEPAAFDQWKTAQIQAIEGSMKNPQRFAGRVMARTIYPESEVRLQPETIDQIQKITLPAAQAWLKKLVTTSPIEVTIVGDVSKEQAEELVTKYLASLPAREKVSSTSYMKERTVQRPQGPRKTEAKIASETEQAFVMCGFYGADNKDVADVRALSLASRIVSTRMIKAIREEAQLVYSIGASSSAATTFPGFGMVQSSATTDPHKVPALVAKVNEMFAEFAKDGPTDEELTVAKKQLAKTFEDQLKEPGYWQGRLDQIDFKGVSLDNVVADPEAIEGLTKEQVQGAFAKYFKADSAIVVTVTPEGGSKDGAKDGGKPVSAVPSKD